MVLTLSVIGLFSLTLIWVILPFLPGLREIQRRADALPLRVVREAEVDIRHFANRFRTFISKQLGEALERCRRQGAGESGSLPDGTEYVVVVTETELAGVGSGERGSPEERVILVDTAVRLPADTILGRELYGADSIVTGARCALRAVLAEGLLELAEDNVTLRWVHAGQTVRCGTGCRLYGRVSAEEAILLAADCRFERLGAPRIEFGTPDTAREPAGEVETILLTPREVPQLVETRAGRWLIDRKFDLPARRRIESDVVVTGRVVLGKQARIGGSVKSRQDMVLGKQVIVDGSLVSGRDLVLHAGCQVRGPIIAERSLTIGPGCVIGTNEQPTTVSARRIQVAPGVICHGTVWAHEEGCLHDEDAKQGKADAVLALATVDRGESQT
jgi:hypothetical protein